MAVEYIDYGKCTGCRQCLEVCPLDVFAEVGKMVFIAHDEDCMSCYLCEIFCPEDCLYVSPGRKRAIPLPY